MHPTPLLRVPQAETSSRRSSSFTPFRSLAAIAPVALLAVGALGCGKGPMNAHTATPECKSGPFAKVLDLAMPAMAPRTPVSLHTPSKLRRLIEPGCIIPFRAQSEQEAEEIDSSVTEVGKVSVTITPRSNLGEHVGPAALATIGSGKLYIGRSGMQIEAKGGDGKVVLYLEIKGKHVIYKAPGQTPLETDIDLNANTPLPLPFDALVSSVDACHDDLRIGIDESGNTVEAKRNGLDLWRTRWLSYENTVAVDTSMVCGATDARFAWRSSAGDTSHDLIAVSARSEMIFAMEIEGTDVDIKGGDTTP